MLLINRILFSAASNVSIKNVEGLFWLLAKKNQLGLVFYSLLLSHTLPNSPKLLDLVCKKKLSLVLVQSKPKWKFSLFSITIFTSYVDVLTQNESNEIFSSIQETQEIDSSSWYAHRHLGKKPYWKGS